MTNLSRTRGGPNLTAEAEEVDVSTVVITNKIVAHFRDGHLLKGTTNDFSPVKPTFHVHETDAAHAAREVSIVDLKALFFVKTYEGDPSHERDDTGTGPAGAGRRIEVTFLDGEVMVGCTSGYSPQKPGFFVVPVDAGGNNERVFVVNAAVSKVRWL